MSENEGKDKPKSEVLKVILIMIVFMLVGVVILIYYPIIKNNIENMFSSQSNNQLQATQVERQSNSNANVDALKLLNTEGMTVAVFNYLTDEVYRSDSNYSVEVRDQNSGYVLRNQENTLQSQLL